MRDRTEIEAEAKATLPTETSPALLWHNPILKLVLEVLLDIRDQLDIGKEKKLLTEVKR